MNLRDVLDRLPLDPALLRKVPVPGLRGKVVLELDLDRGAAEAEPDSPIAALRQRGTPTLRALVDGIERGARDERVVGLVAHTAGQRASRNAVDELHAAVAAFRAAGKPTFAWAETFGELVGGMGAYELASAFEEIWLQPSGDLALSGVSVGKPFVRGTLDKLGVVPQFSGRHEYKTAVDTFRRHDMGEAERHMYADIVASIVDTFVGRVSTGRGLSPDAVRAALDAGVLVAPDALAAGFVDHLGYRDEAFTALHARVGGAPAGSGGPGEHDDIDGDGRHSDDVDIRYVERYRKSVLEGPAAALKRRKRPVVAVVGASGPIVLAPPHGPQRGPSISTTHLGAALRGVADDEHVEAVVLRIDSPGGSYVASDALRREVLALRESGRPVVASMAGVAASGGYFLAMGCDEITATPSTLTGSIGVFAGKQVVAGALGKVGVNVDHVSWGRYAEMFSAQREFTDDEWARLDAWLDRVYADFTAKAAADRGMDLADLEPLARGRVWTGADAARHGLVDTLGGLSTAIKAACTRAGLDRADVDVRAMPKSSPLELFSTPENSDAVSARVGVDAWAARGLADAGEALLVRAAARLGLDVPGALTASTFALR